MYKTIVKIHRTNSQKFPKMKKLTILLLFLSQICIAQTTITSKTVGIIEFNQDTVQSVFVWVADNIKYDVKKLEQIKKDNKSKKKSKFKTDEERKKDMLKKVVKRKRGVCEDYALLFDEIVREFGYESYIVSGYTKNEKGKVGKTIGHAWNVVKVDGTWRLFDATWAAGYVNEKNRFEKKYNEEWYNVSAEEMLKTHLPYDPMFQLSANPMSYKEFEKKVSQLETGGDYNFNELIQNHFAKGEKEQMQDKSKRSEEMGSGIRLVTKWRKTLKKNINIHGVTSQPELINQMNDNLETVTKLFNEHIDARNKNFRGKKRTIEKSKEKLEKSKELLTLVIETFKGIEVEDKKVVRALNKTIKYSEKLLKRVNDELDFVNERIANK